MGDPYYVELYELISFEGFSYALDQYLIDEREILQPQLEALGYTRIIWVKGESDDFGPLTRVVVMTDPSGKRCYGIYG